MMGGPSRTPLLVPDPTGLSARWEPEACPGDVLTQFFNYFFFVLSSAPAATAARQNRAHIFQLAGMPAPLSLSSPVIPGQHLAAQHPPLRLR